MSPEVVYIKHSSEAAAHRPFSFFLKELFERVVTRLLVDNTSVSSASVTLYGKEKLHMYLFEAYSSGASTTHVFDVFCCVFDIQANH